MGQEVIEVWPPSPADILDLPVDEMALRMLRNMARVPGSGLTRHMCTYADYFRDAGPGYQDFNVRRALGEAFDWLRFNGYITEHPDHPENSLTPTKRGIALAQDPKGLSTARAVARIGVDLHPRIAAKVRRQFLLGEYDCAVFLAFREVEIRVRELGNFGDDQFGAKMLSAAFNSTNGLLIDPTMVKTEQEGLAAIFIGAYNFLRNPTGHRQVDYSDVTEASEAVLLADLLMRILDRVTQAT